MITGYPVHATFSQHIRHNPAVRLALRNAVLLGAPGIVLWGLGGFGAFSLMMGLHGGSVTPGVRSSVMSLSLMWGTISLLAAGGIVLGLATLGHRVMRTIGRRITELTPSRGFCAELAAAATVWAIVRAAQAAGAYDATLAKHHPWMVRKGVHLAIEVARRSGRKLIIAGNIPAGHESFFEQRIQPQLGDGIEYVGPVDDRQKNSLYGQAAAFLMPRGGVWGFLNARQKAGPSRVEQPVYDPQMEQTGPDIRAQRRSAASSPRMSTSSRISLRRRKLLARL